MFKRRLPILLLTLSFFFLLGGERFLHHHRADVDRDCAYCAFTGAASESASSLTPQLPEPAGFASKIAAVPDAAPTGRQTLPTGRSPPSFS